MTQITQEQAIEPYCNHPIRASEAVIKLIKSKQEKG